MLRVVIKLNNTPLQTQIPLAPALTFQGLNNALFSFTLRAAQLAKIPFNPLHVACFVTTDRNFIVDHLLTRYDKQVHSLPPFLQLTPYFFQHQFCIYPGSAVTISHFEPLSKIGSGTFAQVYLVRKKYNGFLMASKVMKKQIVQGKNKNLPFKERYCMTKAKSYFIADLFFCFQTVNNLIMVMELMVGGDLFQLNIKYKLEPEYIKVIVFQTVKALQVLHSIGYFYRDLKPQNITIDAEGHVRLIDFGLVLKTQEKEFELSGSLPFIAPQVLQREKYHNASDFFSLGIVLYELSFRKEIPSSKNIKELLSIRKKELQIPQDSDESLRDFIRRLIHPDLTQRLGYRGLQEIYSHPYLRGVQLHLRRRMSQGIRILQTQHRLIQIPLAKQDFQLFLQEPGEPQFKELHYDHRLQISFSEVGPKSSSD